MVVYLDPSAPDGVVALNIPDVPAADLLATRAVDGLDVDYSFAETYLQLFLASLALKLDSEQDGG